MSWRRTILWTITIVWLLWFALMTAANLQEFNSVFPPGPVDAYDLPDLIFWAALMAATYLTPFALILCWRATSKNKRISGA